MSSSAWVICFVSIRFDLDIGPVVEYVCPPGALSTEGERSITQTAFPDCNPKGGNDFIFFFYMRDCTAASEEQRRAEVVANQPEATTTTGGGTGGGGGVGRAAGNIYAATYYRQKKDPSVPRGYVQQAVVLLSRLPYIAVHELILRVVVPRFCQCCPLSPDTEKVPVLSALSPQPITFFEVDSSFNPSQYSQKEVLERAIEVIEGWPSPHPHVQYNLTLLHQPITFVTPKRCLFPSNLENCKHRVQTHLDERVMFLGTKRQSSSVHDIIPLYAILNEHLCHLTQLWELLLCHESLFIWSNTPSMASAVALAVASLVQPLHFNGILRSYLTVQDESFSRYSRMGKTIPFPTSECIIVATTNPFFFRAFDGWQNVLTVIDQQDTSPENSTSVREHHRNDGGSGSIPDDVNSTSNFYSTGIPSNNHAARVSDVTSISNGSGTTLCSPRLFTYSHFFPVLLAAKQTTPLNSDISLSGGGGGTGGRGTGAGGGGGESPVCSQQPVNSFKSNFPFLVDHKAQTALLLRRLEQVSHLSAEAQLVSLNAHVWNNCGDVEDMHANGSPPDVTSADLSGMINNSPPSFHFSIADDIVRKFFMTLTMEFLKPVSAWFQVMTNSLTVFHLCDPAAITAFNSDSFLSYLRDNRESVPSFLSRRPYKAYSVMYERFSKGSLFQSVVWQLVDKKIRQSLEEMQVDVWAAQYPTEMERIEMIINLYKLVEREVTRSIDPDVVFVTMAISVLAEMVTYINEPLRDQLLVKRRGIYPFMLLSDEHVALLAKYYTTVQLTGEQKDLLIEKYWEANAEERSAIARAYSALFARDATFMQRLMTYYDTHVAVLNRGKTNTGKDIKDIKNMREVSPLPAENEDPQFPLTQQQPHSSAGRSSRANKSTGNTVAITHAQLLLRTAIQDQYEKLTGDGPFSISFGLVQTEEERREAVDLYSAQFQYPDPPELQRLVILPQSHSTRTRRRAKGGYTWYIRCQATKEMVCAVTIKAHQYDTQRFVEVPLFATGVGYKKNGFGRLLNAALQEWCSEAGFEFMMISADVQAIPFWAHLGYTTMSKSELTRIAFYYEHNCYKFKGAEAMIWYCKNQRTHAVQTSLQRMPKIVLVGPLTLPNP